MVHKPSLVLLILALSSVLSSVAVPATRSLKSNEEIPSEVQELLPQDAVILTNGEMLIDVGKGYIEGRMDFESTDYPGTGANNHHDPKTPGKA
ncbi:PROTEIN putative-RELATED [Salix koriyanagi]|uniref:PROTEIN putative-RELATED n=1 Tax=Salix koriyanagi TaxID=2511006 RepID=A0A9Q0VZT5_9ROSI|nr:PROTEIN putative-RELATED [Salix koriyanagi]